jgi:hypothetical protein
VEAFEKKTDDVVEYVITAADPVQKSFITNQRLSCTEKKTSQFSLRNFRKKEKNKIEI